jgi:two-component system, NarL family, response regulator LiaR
MNCLPTKLKVIIAENHPIYRDGLYSLISSFDEIGHVELSVDGNDFLSKILSNHYDLALINIKMSGIDCIDAILEARKKNLNLKFIVITMFEGAEYVERALAAGVSAYLLKDSEPKEIHDAIDLVISGFNYFSPKILSGITDRLRNKKNNQLYVSSNPNLTDREIEILKSICMGISRHEIAKTLFISERTFDKHKENILLKTNTTNSVELVHFAIKYNYIVL